MRRLTWMRYNHQVTIGPFGSFMAEYLVKSYARQPMQRTEYYMPWGTVTVDELCKMEYDRSPTILACFDARDDSWFDDDGKLPWQG